MKKILLLGGAGQQIPSIITAKKLGLHTVTCDYLPGNPGHGYADEYYNVSTTDKNAVLNLARKLKIDGIACYASDPSASTAAYVAEEMGLPGNPYRSVEILSNKEKYRIFLEKNGFKTPRAITCSSFEDARKGLGSFNLPVFVKPVDSSGSKGVSLVSDIGELEKNFYSALLFSREKKVIIEEYVDKTAYQVAGDGFSVEGELVFRCFGNDHFDENNLNPFVPVSASFPCKMPELVQTEIHKEIQRLLTLLGMKTGAYNFDIRLGRDGSIYLMEIGPRNGGCYIPQVIRYATGVDLVEYTVKAAMGEDCSSLKEAGAKGFWSYFSIHSHKPGILKDIRIDGKVMANNVINSYLNNKIGDRVQAYTASNATIGVLLMNFNSMAEMLCMMDNPGSWIQLTVE